LYVSDKLTIFNAAVQGNALKGSSMKNILQQKIMKGEM